MLFGLAFKESGSKVQFKVKPCHDMLMVMRRLDSFAFEVGLHRGYRIAQLKKVGGWLALFCASGNRNSRMRGALQQCRSTPLARAYDRLIGNAIDSDCVESIDCDGGYTVKEGTRIFAFASWLCCAELLGRIGVVHKYDG